MDLKNKMFIKLILICFLYTFPFFINALESSLPDNSSDISVKSEYNDIDEISNKILIIDNLIEKLNSLKMDSETSQKYNELLNQIEDETEFNDDSLSYYEDIYEKLLSIYDEYQLKKKWIENNLLQERLKKIENELKTVLVPKDNFYVLVKVKLDDYYKSAINLYKAENFSESLNYIEILEKSIDVFNAKPDNTQVGSADIENDRKIDLYTILKLRKGNETLWSISGKLYKTPLFWPIIWFYNKDIIKNPDRIYPGMILKIPEIKISR